MSTRSPASASPPPGREDGEYQSVCVGVEERCVSVDESVCQFLFSLDLM